MTTIETLIFSCFRADIDNGEDVTGSDEEDHISLLTLRKRMSKKTAYDNPPYGRKKKKPNTRKTSKRKISQPTCTSLRKESESHDVELAKKQSVQLHEKLQKETEEHQHQLNRILNVNSCKIACDTCQDGDCFIVSILHLLNRPTDKETVTVMRKTISDHLLYHESYYKPFFSASKRQYQQLARDVQKTGHWTSMVNDAVPLAVSNILQRKIRIFTSMRIQPSISIDPSLEPQSDCTSLITGENPLLLGYLAVPKHQHYVPVTRVDWRTALHSKYRTCRILAHTYHSSWLSLF